MPKVTQKLGVWAYMKLRPGQVFTHCLRSLVHAAQPHRPRTPSQVRTVQCAHHDITIPHQGPLCRSQVLEQGLHHMALSHMAPSAWRGWNLSHSGHVSPSDSNISEFSRVPCTCLAINKCLLIKSLLMNGDDFISEYWWIWDSCSLWMISQGFCQRRQKRIPNKLDVFPSPTWTNL